MKRMQVSIGDSFEISLKANPSTGYRWHPRFDVSLLDLESRRFERDSSKTGGGGREIFCFTALKTGNTRIVMRFQRGWQPEAEQSETVDVSIIP